MMTERQRLAWKHLGIAATLVAKPGNTDAEQAQYISLFLNQLGQTIGHMLHPDWKPPVPADPPSKSGQ